VIEDRIRRRIDPVPEPPDKPDAASEPARAAP
jgi:hypothetical protein